MLSWYLSGLGKAKWDPKDEILWCYGISQWEATQELLQHTEMDFYLACLFGWHIKPTHGGCWSHFPPSAPPIGIKVWVPWDTSPANQGLAMEKTCPLEPEWRQREAYDPDSLWRICAFIPPSNQPALCKYPHCQSQDSPVPHHVKSEGLWLVFKAKQGCNSPSSDNT